jgi:hypothetical protein
MVFRGKELLGALSLLVCAAIATPVTAQSGQSDQMRLSQENRPPTEGIPQLTSQEVRGTVVRVDPTAEQVELRTASGELRTYRISKADQERNRLQAGSVIVLTVRDETVIAIRPEATTTEATSEASTTTTGTTTGTTTSGSSSTTTIRRETTVQQTRPAPAPDSAAQPEPQSVRGLW